MTLRSAPAVLALLALACLAPLAALAKAAPAVPPDPRAAGLTGTQRLQALIDRVKLEQSGLRTLQARFVQHRESSLLVKPEDSTGEFSYAAPNRVRWEYSSPNPITVVIDGEQMTTWYRDLGRADKLKVGRYSNQVFKYLGASGSMQTLLDYFTVTLEIPKVKSEPYRLELTPRYARIAKRLKSMTLWIDAQRFFPTRVRYVEGDGDVTEYQLKDLQLNPQLPGDRFVLKLPAGVETRIIDLDREASKTKQPGSGS
ncbi:MAG TPA: outer membrane lipoprotein carrier protein LolA [Thermoanaerobaculia bacterium]|jgi:outer membrane lipoprotein carrier protein